MLKISTLKIHQLCSFEQKDSVKCVLHTFQPMLQTVLHHDKELLERCIVRVKCVSEVEGRLDQALNAQFGHVHQVKPFNRNGILGI